jgi:hypothetical protein
METSTRKEGVVVETRAITARVKAQEEEIVGIDEMQDIHQTSTMAQTLLTAQNAQLSSETQTLPVGGRLHHYWRVWEALGAKDSVVKTLRDGLKWEFWEKPVLRSVPWKAQCWMSKRKRELMYPVIQKLLEKGAIEEVTKVDSPGFYSILFLRPKTSGEMRPILDLKILNKLIVNKTFRMESARSIQQAVQPNQWAISIDLTDAYFHIPINHNFRKYLRFAVLDKVFQFRALPFGHIIAPRVFSEVMREVGRILRESGIVVHMYLDDWLIRDDSQSFLITQSPNILELCHLLGLLVNVPKSELTPAQVLEYVGVLYDLALGRAFPPPKRIEKIKSMVELVLSRDQAPASIWLSLLGLVNSVTDQIPLGRLHSRPLQFFLKSQWTMSLDSRRVMIQMKEYIVPHLKWWLLKDNLTVGMPLSGFQPEVQMFTDASKEGWGAHLGELEVSGKWDLQTAKLHINILEMRAVRLAVEHFKQLLVKKSLLIATDNTTTIAYINHQGGTRSWTLMTETQELFDLIQKLGGVIRSRHIPGHLNVLADRLSRKDQILATEWSLLPDVLQILWKIWDKPHVDLFATRHNFKLPLYVSPVPDDSAIAVDALSMDWTNLYGYAYPPTGLIRKVINMILLYRCRIVLIAPFWPDQPWFPDLMRLAVEPPLPLPLNPRLLKQPQKPIFHLYPQRLALHAWLLSRPG